MVHSIKQCREVQQHQQCPLTSVEIAVDVIFDLEKRCLCAVSKPVGRLQWVVYVVISKVFGELSHHHLLYDLAQERQI